MRTRAYRPEAPCSLEDRALLSGVAGLSAAPFVYSRRQFNFFAQHVRLGFELFGRYRDIVQLHDEIEDVVVLVPFQRADGLQESIDHIIDRMQDDLSARVPGAVRTALKDVLAVAHAGVQARVRAGEIVIR